MARKTATLHIDAIIAELKRISIDHVGDKFAPNAITWDKVRNVDMPTSESLLRRFGYKGRRSATAWADFVERYANMVVEPRSRSNARGNATRVINEDNDTGEDVSFWDEKKLAQSEGLPVCWPPRVINEHVYWMVK